MRFGLIVMPHGYLPVSVCVCKKRQKKRECVYIDIELVRMRCEPTVIPHGYHPCLFCVCVCVCECVDAIDNTAMPSVRLLCVYVCVCVCVRVFDRESVYVCVCVHSQF